MFGGAEGHAIANRVEPGKRPRATLTPSLALKDGKPYLAFAVQGGDTQDQNLLQFFLNLYLFGLVFPGYMKSIHPVIL